MRDRIIYSLPKLPIVLLFALCVSNQAYAETLTFREAINAALENNPLLQAHAWSVRARKEDFLTTKGLLYPKLTVEERFTRTDSPTYGFMAKLNQERFAQQDFAIGQLNDPHDISDFQTSFSVDQPLFAPALYYGMGLAEKEMDAGNAEFERLKNEVARSVVRSALAVQTAKEFLSAALAAAADAREHKRLASLRYDSGLGLYSDVLRADVGIKKAEAVVARAEGDLEVAGRALGLVLGRTEAVDVTGVKPSLPLNELNVYMDAAFRRDDLKALGIRYENSLEAVKLEKSFFLPEIGARASYQFNDHNSPFSPEGESYILTASLRWSLFDASLYHKVRKAEAGANEMRQRLTGLEQEVRFRVNEAYIRIREKEKTLSLSKAALEEAEESLRLVKTRYENSLSPIVDLLGTQALLDSARANAVEAENEYINAVADLYHQSGTLLKELGITN
ncbi:MAG: TolC family protein [Nitrospiraceae bacterium]|nr:MAG: TolC family protein [Nitrospiraceae bacterium]